MPHYTDLRLEVCNHHHPHKPVVKMMPSDEPGFVEPSVSDELFRDWVDLRMYQSCPAYNKLIVKEHMHSLRLGGKRIDTLREGLEKISGDLTAHPLGREHVVYLGNAAGKLALILERFHEIERFHADFDEVTIADIGFEYADQMGSFNYAYALYLDILDRPNTAFLIDTLPRGFFRRPH